MDDETGKKIEKKNLAEILEENMRIINAKMPEKEEEFSSEDTSLISADDANLELLEFKNLNYGNKILKPIRKLLHREIRDWIINPIQIKQTEFNIKQKNFNKKLGDTIEEKYSKLEDIIEEKHSKLEDTIEEKHSKLEEKHSELEDTIEEKHSKLEDTIEEKHSKLEDTIEEKHSKLEEKHSELETRFNELLSLENNIKDCYLKILERPADENAIRYYSNKLKSGEIELKNIEEELKKSKEYSILESKKFIYEKYRSKIEKPIFIIGVPRSGTTLVQAILSVHPDLAWMSQNDIDNWLSQTEKHQVINYYQWLKTNNKKIPTSDEALYVLGKNLGPGLKNFPIIPGNSEIPIEGDHFWRKNFGVEYVEDVPLDNKIAIVKEIANIVEKKQKYRFVNKAPQNSMRMFALYKIFPDAKFINVVREPRAIISSMIKRHEDEGEFLTGYPNPNKFEFDELTLVEKSAFRYNQILNYIYDFGILLDEHNFLTVFYEELVKDPKKNIKKILDFCELEASENFEKKIPPIEPDNNKKWHETLSETDEKTISKMLKSILKKTMYPYQL